MKTTAQKHLDAIASGTVTKTNIIGIRKAINHVERLRAGWSGNRSSVTPAEADAMEKALGEVRPVVAGELHESGLKVLRSPRYAKRWKPWQREAIDALDHFRLIRFDRIGRHGEHAVPVYEVWAKIPPKGDALDSGSYQAFSFRNIPWQSAMHMGEESGPVVVRSGAL